MNIAEKIKTLNKSKGYTLKDLSEKIGITEVGLYKALKNNDFKISMLQKIADVLEVDINYFFTGNLPEQNEMSEEILSEIFQQDYIYFKGMKDGATKEDSDNDRNIGDVLKELALSVLSLGNFYKYVLFSEKKLNYILEKKYINAEFYEFILTLRKESKN